MEAQLRALLTGYAPLTALVSSRIYWNVIPQDAVDPAVVMYRITGAPAHTMSGPDDLESSRVQIDVRALNPNSMWAIRDAIKARLTGYRGGSFGGIFMISQRQSSEKPGSVLYHRCMMDFDVHFAA